MAANLLGADTPLLRVLLIPQEMIESVDGIDNGVNVAPGPLAYSQRTDLSSRVKRLNPNWNERTNDSVYDVSAALSPMYGSDPRLALPRRPK